VSDLDDFEPYCVPAADAHPGTIAARLIELPEHAHIKENGITIEYLMCREAKRHQGRQIAGAVHLPTVQGKLKDLFEMLLGRFFGGLPQFLMIIDEAWWGDASEIEREALVFHELKHIQQELDKDGEPKFDRDGNPVFALRDHDVAAFNSEVARYGAWSEDLQRFAVAINQKK
jgi:hypothetical protein